MRTPDEDEPQTVDDGAGDRRDGRPDGSVGSVTTTLPPACSIVIVNGLTYQQCGSTWYQPQYVGSSVQYVVVAPMR